MEAIPNDTHVQNLIKKSIYRIFDEVFICMEQFNSTSPNEYKNNTGKYTSVYSSLVVV